MEKERPIVVVDSDSSSSLSSLDTIPTSCTFDVTGEKEMPVVSDSDSSSGLPSLDTIIPSSTFDVTKLKKDDVVWAEYKDLHWPALVRNVDKKNKKVTVWYLDSPGKSFKVAFKKIRSYNDIDTKISVEIKASKSPFAKKHSRVCSRTLLFIDNVEHGIKVNPIEFFDLSKPFFMVTDYYPGSSKYNIENSSTPGSSESKTSCENASTPGSSKSKVSCENTSLPESSAFNNESASTEKIDKNVDLEESSDDENSTKSDVQENSIKSDVHDHTSAEHFPVFSESPCPYDDEMIDKILSCITAGHIDNYLLGIYKFEIKNELHRSYMEALKTNKTDELWYNPTKSVPINSNRLHPITFYLYELFKKQFGDIGGWVRQYIIMVWLPEAFEKAVSVIKAESLKLPVDSGSNISISDSIAETSELLVDSDSSNTSTSQFQVEESDSSANSSSTISLSALKRKLNFLAGVVKNNAFNTLKAEASTSKKVKFSKRIKQKRQSKALRSVNKRAKPRESSEVKVSRNKTSLSKV